MRHTPDDAVAASVDALLRRLNTIALAPNDPAATRALVVINADGAEIDHAIVCFQAAFPVRVAIGAQPVVVCDHEGRVVPSRLTESILTTSPELPPDRRLWSLTLEFVAEGVPAHGWRAYAARFRESPESRVDDTTFWETLPGAETLVVETDCHAGDLPLIGAFGATITPPPV